MTPIQTAVYETVHRNQASLDEIAEELHISSSYLNRAVNPEDEATDIKLGWLIPLMRFTRNYSILHRLANALGFVVVKIPKAKRMKPRDIARHQHHLAEYFLEIIDVMDGEKKPEQALDKILSTLTEVVQVLKTVENLDGQGDLFND